MSSKRLRRILYAVLMFIAVDYSIGPVVALFLPDLTGPLIR